MSRHAMDPLPDFAAHEPREIFASIFRILAGTALLLVVGITFSYGIARAVQHFTLENALCVDNPDCTWEHHCAQDMSCDGRTPGEVSH